MHAGHVNGDSLKLVRHPLLKVYLSGTSAICRLEILAVSVFETLLQLKKKAAVMSIAFNESIDNTARF